MKPATNHTNNLRILSQLFSPPVFQELVTGDNAKIEKRFLKYIKTSTAYTNKGVINVLYKTLLKNYRCEYIYKNNLFLDILKEYGIADTLTLNEFKIGVSKADLVLLNGSIKVYEVKTELDDLSKLAKQIEDYQKFADKVYIVTNDKFIARLMSDYKHSNIGLICFTKSNQLEVVKEAKDNTNNFDFDLIFKTLRKPEYLALTKQAFGFVPQVPNTKIFRACYDLLNKVELPVFQKMVLNILKKRELQQPSLLTSRKTPMPLKHLCNSLDFNKTQYEQLHRYLSKNSLCTNPT